MSAWRRGDGSHAALRVIDEAEELCRDLLPSLAALATKPQVHTRLGAGAADAE